MDKKLEKLSFEEAMAMLESSAETLKSEKISLEEALSVYDKSIMLYDRCKDILAKARQKVEIYNPISGEKEDFSE